MKILVIVVYFMKILGSVSLQHFGRVSNVMWSANPSALPMKDAAQPDPCCGRISKAATIIE